MTPINNSERQSSIFRFWAIYIVALILPMVAFFYIFKNSGGNSKDSQLLSQQLYELTYVADRITNLDSLSKQLSSLDASYGDLANQESKRLELDSKISATVNSIDSLKQNLSENIGRMNFPKPKELSKKISSTAENVKKYHSAYFGAIKRNLGVANENEELEQLRDQVQKINLELGQCKAEVKVLNANLVTGKK